jgi:ABC-type sugar transport system ATPase subunit
MAPARLRSPPVAPRAPAISARLKAEGVAVILISHRLAEIERAADRVVVLSNGPIAVDAAPDDAFHHCDNPELKAFVDAVRFS